MSPTLSIILKRALVALVCLSVGAAGAAPAFATDAETVDAATGIVDSADTAGHLVAPGIQPGNTRYIASDVNDVVGVGAVAAAPRGVSIRLVGPRGEETGWGDENRTAKSAYLGFNEPTTGRVTLEIRNDTDAPVDATYEVSATARAATVSVTASRGNPSLAVRAEVRVAGEAVRGARVTGTATSPGGSAYDFALAEVDEGYEYTGEDLPSGEYTVIVRTIVDEVTYTGITIGSVTGHGSGLPPMVTISLLPEQPNESGWYTTPVAARIHATDPDGIEWVRYRIGSHAVQTDSSDVVVDLDAAGETTLYAWASDHLGNVSEMVAMSLRIDGNVPEIVHSMPSRARIGQSVTADFACFDAGSGAARCVLLASDGAEFRAGDVLPTSTHGRAEFTLVATDAAGNETRHPYSLWVSDDSAPPSIVVTTEPAASNPRGWFRRDVTATISASDAGSEVAWLEYRVGSGDWLRASGNTAIVTIATDGVAEIGYRASDNDGNVTGERITRISLDRVDPVVTIDASIMGATVEPGTPLTAAFRCTDALSGIATCVGSVPHGTLLPTDKEGTFELSVSAIDRAGNLVTVRAPYTVATAAAPIPAATALASVAANAHGWWRDTVPVTIAAVPGSSAHSVHWELDGAQSGSGFAVGSAVVSLDAEGVTRLSYWAEDAEGGASEPIVLELRIDRTAPRISYLGIEPRPVAASGVPMLTLSLGERQVIAATCGDAGGSGVAECESPLLGIEPLDTSTPGEFTVRTRALDHAGNATEHDLRYRVMVAAGGETGSGGGKSGAGSGTAGAPTSRNDGREKASLADTGTHLLVPASVASAILLLLGFVVLAARRRRA